MGFASTAELKARADAGKKLRDDGARGSARCQPERSAAMTTRRLNNREITDESATRCHLVDERNQTDREAALFRNRRAPSSGGVAIYIWQLELARDAPATSAELLVGGSKAAAGAVIARPAAASQRTWSCW